jgi:hypothetical protein
MNVDVKAAEWRVMELSSDVQKFGSACEYLLASVAIHRPLKDDEVQLIEYYCNELLKKVRPPLK